MINIYLNGTKQEIPAETDMSRLLEIFSLPFQRIAIELNKAVVRRSDWSDTIISEGDRIEVVHFVGGG